MKHGAIILIVEDQASEREALGRLLRLNQYQVRLACDAEQALAILEEPIDLVISDLRMGERSGLDLLQLWKQRRPETPFIMLTAFGEVGTAVNAMKLGADDYLTKPVNPEQLLLLVRNTTERRPSLGSGHLPVGDAGLAPLVGASPLILEVVDRAYRVAQTESLVLVLGESGTGKELLAAAIHHHSRRKDGPYVAVNVAAIPESLVESELFGHVKGAFTGAATNRMGRFALAQSGTLFIDEIGDFPLSAQAKLLRVLENFTISPVGSDTEFKVDTRIVAATSRNLSELVAQRKFREDLYYRLNVVTLVMPPLRDRRDDILLLFDTFLNSFCRAVNRGPLKADPSLLDFLEAYHWPGNVRQLRNAVESMVVLAKSGVLTIDDLPPHIRESQAGGASSLVNPSANLEELEKATIRTALRDNAGNRTHAAGALGISVRTLQRKLKSWGWPARDDEK